MPHPRAHKITFTKEGFEKLQKEQQDLILRRPEAVAELKRAREMGDLSENGAYKSARALVSQIDSRLRHVHYLLQHAVVVEAVAQGIVGLNSTIVVTDGSNERELVVVGEHESDPLSGKISHKSPLGQALMGKKAGEEATIATPKGTLTYHILQIM